MSGSGGRTIEDSGGARDGVLVHCTSAYPRRRVQIVTTHQSGLNAPPGPYFDFKHSKEPSSLWEFNFSITRLIGF